LKLEDINDDLDKINDLIRKGEYEKSFELQQKYMNEFNEIFFETLKILINKSILGNDFKKALEYLKLSIRSFESKI
jgi:hypothetical protein